MAIFKYPTALTRLHINLCRAEFILCNINICHDDVIKWKPFPRIWPFVRGIHRWPVNSPHKSPLRGALMFSLICAWINGWVSNCEAGDLRCHHAHYDVIVMIAFSAILRLSDYINGEIYLYGRQRPTYLMQPISRRLVPWRPKELKHLPPW